MQNVDKVSALLTVNIEKADYQEILKIEPQRKSFKKPNILFRTLMKLLSIPDMLAVKFRCEKVGMERLGKKEPCFILMNHSSFIDFEILSTVLYPRAFNIVATMDAYIGKNWLMRQIGCIETKKFAVGVQLIRDMNQALKNKSSVLMFPEAGYSLDGRATVLPDSLGKCVKFLGVPLVTLTTRGAFSRQPLYNNLRKRKVSVSAKLEYLLSPQEIKEKSVEEINEIIRERFTFDGFRWQQEENIKIDDPNRAEGLHRVLYKCPHCLAEGKMESGGVSVKCVGCGKEYVLTELGALECVNGEGKFTQVSDWVDWERDCVKREIEEEKYGLDIPVDIYMMVDTVSVYDVGQGNLKHDANGFVLNGCEGKLQYEQSVLSTYCINSDFYWYQIADVINIGDLKKQYFCIPKVEGAYVFKTRLAVEELYKKAKR